jgi:hypothetical protein
MAVTSSRRLASCSWVVLLAAAFSVLGAGTARAQGAGALSVKFFYDTPTTVEPTYHTVVWLEDKAGKLVKTLFVSAELSSKEFKMGNACPDWVKVARWDTVPKDDVAAVTAPTPSVGNAEMSFDLAKLKVAPGTYRFKLQVHVSEEFNLLYSGDVTVGGAAGPIKLDVKQGPGKLETSDQFVRDVDVRYVK